MLEKKRKVEGERIGNPILRLSVEYDTREVSHLSFTVKTLLLLGAIMLVSIGTPCVIDVI